MGIRWGFKHILRPHLGACIISMTIFKYPIYGPLELWNTMAIFTQEGQENNPNIGRVVIFSDTGNRSETSVMACIGISTFQDFSIFNFQLFSSCPKEHHRRLQRCGAPEEVSWDPGLPTHGFGGHRASRLLDQNDKAIDSHFAIANEERSHDFTTCFIDFHRS